MNDILIHTSRLYHKPQKPDKSRPCQIAQTSALILRFLFFLNVVDSEVYRTKQTLVIILPLRLKGTSTEGLLIQKNVYAHSSTKLTIIQIRTKKKGDYFKQNESQNENRLEVRER